MPVKVGIDGMETIVKKFISAQEEEFIMKHFNNVFVGKDTSGMDLPVWFNLNVAVEKDGMNKSFNVSVLKALTGMVIFVFSVSMEEFGTNNNTNVSVVMELNGMDNSAL